MKDHILIASIIIGMAVAGLPMLAMHGAGYLVGQILVGLGVGYITKLVLTKVFKDKL